MAQQEAATAAMVVMAETTLSEEEVSETASPLSYCRILASSNHAKPAAQVTRAAVRSTAAMEAVVEQVLTSGAAYLFVVAATSVSTTAGQVVKEAHWG